MSEQSSRNAYFIRVILTSYFYPGNIPPMPVKLKSEMSQCPSSCTAFEGNRQVASGSYLDVALAVRALLGRHREETVLIFDDDTGRQVDFDLRGTEQDIATRLMPIEFGSNVTESVRGAGRPKLGVVAREVTLLPRHWEWLATQSGGASAALRKLVEEARRTHGEKDRIRQAHDRAYNFMSAIVGNLPGFEETSRALFANDQVKFSELIGAWPSDVRDHATRLAFGDDSQVAGRPGD